ncbi:MAG TPA: PQQ-binding-like beta-propeller repeat protein [Opitutaceae bacterium]|nr:PQQ-binding-like beta-propeller repeat protein [Opitutaceae bacterium]
MLTRIFPVLLLAVPAFAAQDAHSLFADRCGVCHGGDATGTDRGPALLNNRRLGFRSEADIATTIRNGTPRGMPPIPLPDEEIARLAAYVRSLNLSAFESRPAGDLAAGETFFFGKGECAKCHTAAGRGSSSGPDLSNIARQLTLSDLVQSLVDPSARISPGYGRVVVTLKAGGELRGFARSRGSHDLQLQTDDGKLHLLTDDDYTKVADDRSSSMPALNATPDERTNLIAWLSRLDGSAKATVAAPPADPAEFEAILHASADNWTTYHGNLSGNRYSALEQINPSNVARLQLQWAYPMPYQPLETTPLVVDGVMYVTGPNTICAVDARSGREIWKYTRARSSSNTVAADAAIGANRGVAWSGDRIFYTTDNAHMICLHRLTGALLWDVPMPEDTSLHYGATSAPLVINDLVISGVGGGDDGIRGFIAAYKITTGELAWRFWTVPKPGEPGAETWKGEHDTLALGGGATWLTGTYDPETGLLYWPTGNPYPDTDGTDRSGDNLYTNCDIALDPKTGKMKWYFQFTPHDLHDWDANQPPVLVNAKFHGQDRKLLLHANRNGYFYVLDRVTGEMLLSKPFVRKLTWSTSVDANGRPILTSNYETTPAGVKTCPAVRGATNWYATAFNPKTNLYYVMSVEDCSLYRMAQHGGFGPVNDPLDPAAKYLRAIDIETGDVRWEIEQIGPVERNYSGVLATASNLVFYGETSGGFAAVDAATGKTLWHFQAGATWKASPITYRVNGRQYVAIASGANILSFALPAE